MQAILGYSNLLDRRLPPGDPNHETVEHIQKSLAHASSLTRQLLAFSRKQVLKPKLLAFERRGGRDDPSAATAPGRNHPVENEAGRAGALHPRRSRARWSN